MKTNYRFLLAHFFLVWSLGTNAQNVITTNVAKKITSLKSTPEGYLLYGTEGGEIGLYDGAMLTRQGKLQGSINAIQITNDKTYALTDKGLYTGLSSPKILSQNNLNVLDRSDNDELLITSAGVYDKQGNDYIPNREEFYEISDVSKGDYFRLGATEYLRLDRAIYKKDKSWKEAILHRQADFSLAKWNDQKMIIADSFSIVSCDTEGYLDTLYRLDSVGLSKIFNIGNSQLLFCVDNQVNLFDIRKREMTNIKEINTSLLRAATKDNWGNIWVAAGSYLYKILPNINSNLNNRPTIAINAIRVNGNPIDDISKIKLKKGNNDIEISYSGVHLTYPQDLEYETRLTLAKENSYPPDPRSDQFEDVNQWSTPTIKKEIEYRNLPPGEYKFELRASVNPPAYVYAKPISISVVDDTIEKLWIIGILGLLGVFLSAIFFNNRYNRLKEKSAQERKILKQENKMLTLQQKALQLQMNPHFVFNALNSIQGLIAKEDNKNARRYLQQFSSMMRSVLNQSREESIVLDDEMAYLESYLSLEQMANNNSFDFEISKEDSVEDGIKIPTMIIQPFIENAILHGVKGLKNKRGSVHVSFSQKNNFLSCTISDNGIGREAAAIHKKPSHKSVAINVVNERLKGKYTNQQPVIYHDLKDEHGIPTGTKVEISMPIT